MNKPRDAWWAVAAMSLFFGLMWSSDSLGVIFILGGVLCAGAALAGLDDKGRRGGTSAD